MIINKQLEESKMNPTLINGFEDIVAHIKNQEQRIMALEEENKKLEEENKKLKEEEYQPKGSRIDPEGLHDLMKEQNDKLKKEYDDMKQDYETILEQIKEYLSRFGGDEVEVFDKIVKGDIIEDHENCFCDNCNQHCGPDDAIFIFERGIADKHEDTHFCNECGYDLYEKMRSEGWRRDDDEE